MTTKTSTALLAAWFVVIAGLIAAVVFFSMKGCAPATPTDPPVVKIPPKPTVKPVRPIPRRGDAPHSEPSARGAAPKRFSIEGIVRVPGGDPVQGAHVALFEPNKAGKPVGPANHEELQFLNSVIYIAVEDADTPRPLSGWTGDMDRVLGPETEIAGADTGADGKFTVTLPSKFGSGPYRLKATKENVGETAVNEVSAGGEPLQLMLGSAASVKGTVVTDVDSVPVEGAHVIFDNGARRFAAVTDSAGKFVDDGVTPGVYQLIVAATGRTPLFEPKFRLDALVANMLTLRLPRGTTLTVKTVVEKDEPAATARNRGDIPSDPVPNAKVVAFNPDMNVYVTGISNADGVVVFPGLPGGPWQLNGQAKGFVSQGELTVTVDKNQLAQEETLPFDKAVDTPIEVVDEDGRAVAGVEFWTVNNDDKYDQVRSIRAGVTDGDGKMKFPFEFDGPRSQLIGFKSGYAVVRASPEAHDSGDPLKLVAKKPIRVHGVVKTSEGRAVPDAVVTIDVSSSDPNAAFQDYSLQIRSDAQGRYDFANLPREDGITLGASGPDGISQEDKDLELADGKSDYEIDLVLDLDDAPPVAPKPRKPESTPNPMKR